MDVHPWLFNLVCIFAAGLVVAIILSAGEYIMSKVSDCVKGLALMAFIGYVCISIIYGLFFAKPVRVHDYQADREEQQYNQRQGIGRL